MSSAESFDHLHMDAHGIYKITFKAHCSRRAGHTFNECAWPFQTCPSPRFVPDPFFDPYPSMVCQRHRSKSQHACKRHMRSILPNEIFRFTRNLTEHSQTRSCARCIFIVLQRRHYVLSAVILVFSLATCDSSSDITYGT